MTSHVFHRITVALSALQLLVIPSKLRIVWLEAVKFIQRYAKPSRYADVFQRANFRNLIFGKTALNAGGFNSDATWPFKQLRP